MIKKSNKLISLLVTLDRSQRRNCRKLIQSPLFSTNDDLLALFDEINKRLDKNKSLDKQEIWSAIRGKSKPYNDARFRKFTSDLFKLVKRYLIQETLEQEPELQRYLYFSALEKQKTGKLIKGVERNWDGLVTPVNSTEAKSFLFQHLLELKKHALLNYGQRRNERSNLEEISHSLDRYFIVSKLKNAVEAKSRNINEKQVYNLHLTKQVVTFLDENDTFLNEPLITAYYFIYKMLASEEANQAYFSYKKILLNRHPTISLPPRYTFILPALNYCIVALSQGRREFMKEYLELYQFALSEKIAFQNDTIDPGSFKNTVQIAMQLSEFDWAENYIRTYQDKLPESDKENTVNYNLAMVYFYQKKFSEAQSYLAQVEYKNIDLNLNTKMLLLAIYYELGQDQVLESFFDSTISYLNRHKELTATRDRSYRNLVLFTRRLTRLLPNDKAGLEKLRQEVTEERYVVSKAWLEQKIEEFAQR